MRDLTRLPEEVTKRLDVIDLAPLMARRDGRVMESRVQRSDIEVRDNSDGSITVRGYATIYDHAYQVAGGAPYGWDETMVQGAADKSVAERQDDVQFLINHDGMTLARWSPRHDTLSLESDKTGLFTEATLSLKNPAVQALASGLERKDIDEMSFAFQVMRQEWNEDYTERFITEVKLFDVSAVNKGANPATVIGLRSEDRGMSLDFAQALAFQLDQQAS